MNMAYSYFHLVIEMFFIKKFQSSNVFNLRKMDEHLL